MGEEKRQDANVAERILARFTRMAADPFGSLKELRQATGKKVVACMPMQIPEEMVHAAGAVPVVIPESPEPVTIGARHLQSFFCGYARNMVDEALKGRLDFLDGMVFQDTCHTMRPMYDIIHANRPSPYMERMFLPVALEKPQARPFLLRELEAFRKSLSRFAARPIDDAALQASIDVYNENRELMAALYCLRRARPELITAREMVAVNLAAMLMPKEEHSLLLKELIPALSERKPPLADAAGRVRLIVTGSLCEAPSPLELLDCVEEMGGIIVDDDLYTGSRYFLTKVASGPNPVEALADAYLHMVAPCPTRLYSRLTLGPYLVSMVKKADAKGVLIVMVKFCEAHDYTYPHMRRHFDPERIPYLMIKTEHESASLEQVKTRIQAFVEIVRGR